MRLHPNLENYLAAQQETITRIRAANIPESVIVSKVLLAEHSLTRETHPKQYSITSPTDSLEVNHLGIIGDRHYRSVRPSGPRERELLPKKSVIREHRHIFAVSLGDCQALSDLVGVQVTPCLLGANLVLEREDGKPYSLSALPQGTYLRIAMPEVVTVGEITTGNLVALLQKQATQEGCGVTGASIQDFYNMGSTIVKQFCDSSKLNRGIVCSVEYPAEGIAKIKPGQRIFFGFPTGYTP